ncbi:MAG: ribosomal protein S19 family protein [Candidatus Woesearchaeota archaeon]|nr:ribosomal protein S19 family protein [Candidatus Woesearchaeota archaeon]
MAKKEFTFKGLRLAQLQELSLKEFAALVPSRERRSLLRGLTPEETNLVRKLEKRDNVKTHTREMIILPNMVGKTIQVHNGKGYEKLVVNEEMLGKRLGQFVLTRKIARHASPGVTKQGVKVK